MPRTQHPVRANELQCLQRALGIGSTTRRTDVHKRNAPATLPGAFGKGLDHRRVSHIRCVVAGHVWQRIELLAPIFRHRLWIGQVLFVEFFDIRRIGTEEQTALLKFSHHGEAFTFVSFRTLQSPQTGAKQFDSNIHFSNLPS